MKSNAISKTRSNGARKSTPAKYVKSERKPRTEQQLSLLPNQKPFFGGDLMKKARGRLGSRPLAVKKSMHIVLRSSKAVGSRSFQTAKNRAEIQRIIRTHAARNHVRVFSTANVGNHIHLHVQLGYRDGYFKFIRAITAAIAMHVMEWNRWTIKKERDAVQRFTQPPKRGHAVSQANTIDPEASTSAKRNKNASNIDKERLPKKAKFWDYRPYTNVVTSWTGFLRLKEYVQINQFQAGGLPKDLATLIVRNINPLANGS